MTKFKSLKNKIEFRHILFGIFGVALIGTLGFLLANNMKETDAADMSGFRAGNIMSDEVMSDYNSMSEGDIQNWLSSINPCNNYDRALYEQQQAAYPNVRWHFTDHFICISEERFGNGTEIGWGDSAAHIIWQAAQDYRINPQVLIVLLQKENGLITDTFPHSGQYKTATGFGCPDSAPCEERYFGLRNQIRLAAQLFRDVLDGGWSNYPAYQNNYVRWSPHAECGGTDVYIENRATSALYRYTPYQPNGAALFGEGDWCSAYGNRNFYAFFTDWFGDTHYNGLTEASRRIRETYDSIGGANRLGNPIGTTGHSPDTGAYYQQYELGYIVGSNATGYYESFGKIRNYWEARGYETSKFGFPTSNVIRNNETNTWYQDFQHGSIVGNDNVEYHESVGMIREYWRKTGFEYGKLGLPISDEFYNPATDTYYQNYEHGVIVGRNNLGYHISVGGIRETWKQLGFESGQLGLPVTDIDRNDQTDINYQQYERGYIVGNDNKGYYQSTGLIREYWKKSGFEAGPLGFPTSNEFYNTATDTYYQNYEHGVIVGRNNLGFHISKGGIRDAWQRLGYESGKLGLPITDIDRNDQTNINYQQYEHGFIVGNDDKGYYESTGEIREAWKQNGFEAGRLGFPISDVKHDDTNDTDYQQYEHGTVYYKSGRGTWISYN